jgi:hypothetical protein
MGDPLSLGLGAIGATANAFKLVQAFNDVRDATKVQALKFELMGLLLEAQQTQAALVAEKRDLAERVRQLETWEGEKQRYQLTNVGWGATAFVLKPEAQGSEAAHMLCANCFQHGHPSILQYDRKDMRGAYACPKCKSGIMTNADTLRELNLLPPLRQD